MKMSHKIVSGRNTAKYWLVVKWEDGVRVKHPAESELEAQSVFNRFYRIQGGVNAQSRKTVRPSAV